MCRGKHVTSSLSARPNLLSAEPRGELSVTLRAWWYGRVCSVAARVAHHTPVCTVILGLRLWGAGGGKGKEERGKEGKGQGGSICKRGQETQDAVLSCCSFDPSCTSQRATCPACRATSCVVAKTMHRAWCEPHWGSFLAMLAGRGLLRLRRREEPLHRYAPPQHRASCVYRTPTALNSRVRHTEHHVHAANAWAKKPENVLFRIFDSCMFACMQRRRHSQFSSVQFSSSATALPGSHSLSQLQLANRH